MKRSVKRAVYTCFFSLAAAFLLCLPVEGAGWKKTNGRVWFERKDGTWPENEWENIGNRWYYFDNEGYRVSGWQLLDGGWYYFGEETDGSMKRNTWVDGYYVDSDGRMLSDTWVGNYWVEQDGKQNPSVGRSVQIPLEGISLSAETVDLLSGETANLYPGYTPKNTTDVKRAVWKSSDPAVASVSGGKVTGKSAGTAVITAAIDGYEAQCTVTVYDSPVCRTALSLLGDQYIWGGNGPADGGVDCSGLLMYAYTQNGYDFGADLSADKFAQYGREVAGHELQPGDAICCCFGNDKYQHILLYIGNNMVVASECGGPAVCTVGKECNRHGAGTVCKCRVVKRALNENDLLNAKFVRMDDYLTLGK